MAEGEKEMNTNLNVRYTGTQRVAYSFSFFLIIKRPWFPLLAIPSWSSLLSRWHWTPLLAWWHWLPLLARRPWTPLLARWSWLPLLAGWPWMPTLARWPWTTWLARWPWLHFLTRWPWIPLLARWSRFSLFIRSFCIPFLITVPWILLQTPRLIENSWPFLLIKISLFSWLIRILWSSLQAKCHLFSFCVATSLLIRCLLFSLMVSFIFSL